MKLTADLANQALVLSARAEWNRGVRDFQTGLNPTPKLIQRYFDLPGWHWFLEKYSDGTYTEKWKNEPWQEWCGLFVAHCGLTVGNYIGAVNDFNFCADVQLDRGVASSILPSTLRLADEGRWAKHGGQPIRPKPQDAKRGDIITVGSGRTGSHIALVADQDAGDYVRTYEGNATGMFPDGTEGEGVIRTRRSFEEIKQVIRLKSTHYQGTSI